MRLMCFGFGYTARALVRRFGSRFETIGATIRERAAAESLTREGIVPVPLCEAGQFARAVHAADAILVSAAPDETGDPFIARAASALRDGVGGSRILYLSTVGVYGDHDGAWVTEESTLRPVSRRSRWRVAAEEAWQALALHSGAQLQIFRLAGIYGPGRGPLQNVLSGKARRIVKPGQVFNRIHVDDIAGALIAALSLPQQDAIWNVADDEPAPPQDVLAYAADMLGLPPPPEVPFERAEMTAMARSFYSENKRVSNRALRETLGVELVYPTYREGMAALAGSLK